MRTFVFIFSDFALFVCSKANVRRRTTNYRNRVALSPLHEAISAQFNVAQGWGKNLPQNDCDLLAEKSRTPFPKSTRVRRNGCPIAIPKPRNKTLTTPLNYNT